MFKKANKSELKTWMIGDIILFIICTIASISMLGTYVNDKKISYLIFGIIFICVILFCAFMFIKMIKAYITYDGRKKIMDEQAEKERLQKEQEEKERLQNEQEETKKFIEEYHKKVQEAEEQRKKEHENENRNK
ncbi:MAG: hypothetical protein SOU07_04350 [Bacilli bacterium]|nr:hypothetical protein [Acholeplasmataceae bacterium]MDY2902651.1 hypothetical protein [Bacilli bacterium]